MKKATKKALYSSPAVVEERFLAEYGFAVSKGQWSEGGGGTYGDEDVNDNGTL